MACAAAGTAPACAAEYAWEAAGLFAETEIADVGEVDTDALRATYYFGGVDDGNGPYALAAFLDPKSSVSLGVQRADQTFDLFTPPDAALPELFPFDEILDHFDTYGVDGRYVLRDSLWYFGGRYAVTEVDLAFEGFAGVSDRDEYGVLVGKYLNPTTTVELALGDAEQSSEVPISLCVPGFFCVLVEGPFVTELERDQAQVAVRHVGRWRASTYALSGSAAQTDGRLTLRRPAFTIDFPPFMPIAVPAETTIVDLERVRAYSASGEIFPNERLGVRLGYTRWDGETPSDEAYEVAASWFVTRNVGLQLTFVERASESDSEFPRVEGLALGIVGRL